MICCALCCAVLCCAVLCCAVLCCAMPTSFRPLSARAPSSRRALTARRVAWRCRLLPVRRVCRLGTALRLVERALRALPPGARRRRPAARPPLAARGRRMRPPSHGRYIAWQLHGTVPKPAPTTIRAVTSAGGLASRAAAPHAPPAQRPSRPAGPSQSRPAPARRGVLLLGVAVQTSCVYVCLQQSDGSPHVFSARRDVGRSIRLYYSYAYKRYVWL